MANLEVFLRALGNQKQKSKMAVRDDVSKLLIGTFDFLAFEIIWGIDKRINFHRWLIWTEEMEMKKVVIKTGEQKPENDRAKRVYRYAHVPLVLLLVLK